MDADVEIPILTKASGQQWLSVYTGYVCLLIWWLLESQFATWITVYKQTNRLKNEDYKLQGHEYKHKNNKYCQVLHKTWRVTKYKNMTNVYKNSDPYYALEVNTSKSWVLTSIY